MSAILYNVSIPLPSERNLGVRIGDHSRPEKIYVFSIGSDSVPLSRYANAAVRLPKYWTTEMTLFVSQSFTGLPE